MSPPFTTNHYHRPQLLELIISKLDELGWDKKNLQRKDIAALDEFHLLGATVSQEIAAHLNLTGGQLMLDVGCGIGGPCRMLADEFACTVIGLDFTAEYIRVAQALTRMVGLHHRVSFVLANALQIPFENATFDGVWTQHVQMNIADKARFYSEIQRVTKPGGRFVYYDIFEAGSGEITFPVPWAESPQYSFLIPHTSVADYFDVNRFELIYTKNLTLRATSALNRVVESMVAGTAPPLGLNILMGDSTVVKLKNLLRGLTEGKVEVLAGIFQRK